MQDGKPVALIAIAARRPAPDIARDPATHDFVVSADSRHTQHDKDNTP